MTDVLDLHAYLARIGYRGDRSPTLVNLHALTAAHTKSIPFENLDVLLGRPIDLEPVALFRKLVTDRRGGYCFEQNGLFLHVLEALGYSVKPLSARVRLQRPRDFLPPRTHVFLRVELEGESWLTDVGVGAASLTSAIRFVHDLEQPTDHEPRRIVREGSVDFHQVRHGEVWNDVYEFTGEEMPLVDRTVASWFTSAHPHSHFRDRLMAARALDDGRRLTLLNRELTMRARDGSTETRSIDTPEELLKVLAESFGLEFPAGTRFGTGESLPWAT